MIKIEANTAERMLKHTHTYAPDCVTLLLLTPATTLPLYLPNGVRTCVKKDGMATHDIGEYSLYRCTSILLKFNLSTHCPWCEVSQFHEGLDGSVAAAVAASAESHCQRGWYVAGA